MDKSKRMKEKKETKRSSKEEKERRKKEGLDSACDEKQEPRSRSPPWVMDRVRVRAVSKRYTEYTFHIP